MNRKKRINKLLNNKLRQFSLSINDNSYLHRGHNDFDGSGETHIQIVLKKNNNNKINRLEIHKLINDLLEEEFKTGLHALEIKIIN